VILVDTTAWIEFVRGTGSAAHQRLAELIVADAPVAVTEPIMMEVLAGARDDRAHADLRRLLLRCEWLPFDAAADFESAAAIYRRCRRAGVTPRGLLDCMIAAVALRHGATLLSHDRDFSRIADTIGLRLDEPAR
jgi:predicted nucleic acid-binding protein